MISYPALLCVTRLSTHALLNWLASFSNLSFCLALPAAQWFDVTGPLRCPGRCVRLCITHVTQMQTRTNHLTVPAAAEVAALAAAALAAAGPRAAAPCPPGSEPPPRAWPPPQPAVQPQAAPGVCSARRPLAGRNPLWLRLRRPAMGACCWVSLEMKLEEMGWSVGKRAVACWSCRLVNVYQKN